MGPLIVALLIVGGFALASRRSAASTFAPNSVMPPLPPAVMLGRYAPGSAELAALFARASTTTPVEWADPKSVEGRALHQIVANESDGWVGRPNFQFGAAASVVNRARWPAIWNAIRNSTWRILLVEPYRSRDTGKQSSATGLGQLTSTNIATGRYYPHGLAGIGDAEEEAIGMLKYIAERYSTPSAAVAFGMKTGKWSGY